MEYFDYDANVTDLRGALINVPAIVRFNEMK